MEKTWRWFGPSDVISLKALRQIGVEGIVTALHHIPNGEIWTREEIRKRREFIEAHGLRWSVVESLPVTEEIKLAGSLRDRHLKNYLLSLENLGMEGIHTVCYNFMPVIDWIRTDLYRPNPDGTKSLYFDYARFACFDLYILKREGAGNDYPEEIREQAKQLYRTMTEEEKRVLVENIIVKTQGFVSGNITEKDKQPVALFKKLLARYQGVDKTRLRQNFRQFMSAVAPVAERSGVNLCIHPDDPPFPVLGLPRIVTCKEDVEWLLSAVDSPVNGLTFCAGSLSSGIHNDVPELARRFAARTHFVHLRSTEVSENRNFGETDHLSGRGLLAEVIRIFLKEQERRKKEGWKNWRLPMRPDHGPLMLADIENNQYNPGYSFYGRMKALAELSGMMAAIKYLDQK
ncbi:MAG: mannonate dehydratase [Bacteroidales bacterium]|jgi:mannonate dehydratase|nr:mannonate dehydratase [Bacteroidales bacterium]NLH24137.1 mannonate dehydratase [Bacteroidales bacterium]HPJ82418.1 mannonate dehydratase [Bacteroidales bacterium]